MVSWLEPAHNGLDFLDLHSYQWVPCHDWWCRWRRTSRQRSRREDLLSLLDVFVKGAVKHQAQSRHYLYSYQLLWWSKDDLCPAVSSVSDSFPPLCNCQSQTPCRTLSCTSHWAPHSRPVETPRTRLSDLSSPDHNADWPAWAELFLNWFNKVYIGEPFITPRLFHDLHRLNPRLPREIMFL